MHCRVSLRRAEKFLDLVAAQVAAHAPVLPKWRVSALGVSAVVDGCMAAGNDHLSLGPARPGSASGHGDDQFATLRALLALQLRQGLNRLGQRDRTGDG